MTKIYQYIEFILLAILLVRIVLAYSKGLRIDPKYIDILLFYSIWYTNNILTWIIPNSTLTFYFVHCTFPIFISGVMLFKARPLLFYVLIIAAVCLNLYFHNRQLIDLTYLLTYFLILLRILRLHTISKRNRGLIPIFSLMLAVLVLTHLVFMFGYLKVNWSESIYISYFIFLLILTYISSLILSHAHFRRFLTY
jgi:hypothetical protein